MSDFRGTGLVPSPLCVVDTETGRSPCLGPTEPLDYAGGPLAGADLMTDWLIPVDRDDFFDELFNKRVLHVARSAGASPHAGLLTSDEVWEAVASGLPYGTSLDVVQFDDDKGVRVTLNKAEGDLAPPATVRSEFRGGASLRLLHPQRWPTAAGARVRAALASLEGFFECIVGCNAYFTPPGHQGFAPHWDDVDVFILQLEGAKTWRVHAPRCEAELLPRESSADFHPGDAGAVTLETTLEPGHLLYLPRGTTHSALTPARSKHASLHVTISVCHRRTWADMMALTLPAAVEEAAEACPDLRRALPVGCGRFMGLAHEGRALPVLRADFKKFATRLAATALSTLPLDAVVDRLAVDFIWARVPPARPPPWPRGAPLPAKVAALAGGSAARIVVEGDVIALYHCLDNDAACHAADPSVEGAARAPARGRLEFPPSVGPALEVLLEPVAGPLTVADLPQDEGEGDGGDSAVLDAVRELLCVGLLLPV